MKIVLCWLGWHQWRLWRPTIAHSAYTGDQLIDGMPKPYAVCLRCGRYMEFGGRYVS